MRSTAEGAAAPREGSARAWQRGATRRAIFDAARFLTGRDGVDDLTLNAVATEAGYSTTTIFAYFQTKEELITAIVADDLAAFAREMCEHYVFAPRAEAPEETDLDAKPHSEVEEPSIASLETQAPLSANASLAAEREPESTEATTVEPEAREPERPTSSLASLLAKREPREPAAPALPASIAALMPKAEPAAREPVSASSSVASLMPQPEAAAEAKPEDIREKPKVDVWLERRLRVFEKMLSDVESRLGATEQDSSRALQLAQENSQILGARMDASEKRILELSNDLSTRMSAAEKRLRDTHIELRNNLLNASMRIDQLENVAQQLSGGAPLALQPKPVEMIEPEENADRPADKTDKPYTAAADSYLSAARRAARTAAQLAEMEKKPKLKVPRVGGLGKLPFTRKTLMIALASMLVVFAVGARVAYAIGESVGRATPVRIVMPRGLALPRVAPHSAKAAQISPLDRLAALANAGNPKAELMIGLRYHKGDGVSADQREAAKWIMRAAETHDPLAQYWLGELYQNGDGVSADAAEAVHWYEAAAGQGNRQAMHDLGIAYAEGLGAEKDLAESARWFAKAAALGLVNSEFNLAVLYERGEGVTQSLVTAYKWYAIAAAQGDGESKSRADVLATQIDPEALAEARAQAAAFKPEPLDPDANTVSLPGT
ncbi:MAG TPA: TetR family transcriptional regulator [Rhizomicrobium sp.]|nr:TetR family transcriptional regulator [Rhizomicrobium sp.]